MNYIRIFQDSIGLIRTNKLIMVFGFLALLPTSLVFYLRQFLPPFRGNTLFVLLGDLYILVAFAVVFFYLIAECSLIFCIYQASINNSPTFFDAWFQGKSRVLRLIRYLILTIPVLLIYALIHVIVAVGRPSSTFMLFVYLISQAFMNSMIIFGVCAIMINDIGASAAAWTSFLITLNHFLRVLIINVIVSFVQLLLIGSIVMILVFGFRFQLPTPLTLTYLTYQRLSEISIITAVDLFLNPFFITFTTAVLVLGYLRFTKEISYPGLSKRQGVS